ncbi:hypothetical protein [Streptomyces sp. NPDC050704]|uniref:hypothetical protein n=1 Tax=Streptomyces sp. NPDC050704 TaxID=3157219 RepID=UPI00342BF15E
MVKLLERVAAARAEAGRETCQRVRHLLTPKLRGELGFLRGLDAHTLDLTGLPADRRQEPA